MDIVRKFSLVFLLWLLSLVKMSGSVADIYHNQFAVHVPAGRESADAIAAKHGFVNVGQIGSLDGHFLFEHPRIAKRSTDRSSAHDEKFGNEPDVVWFEQQKELHRKKRDVSSALEMPGELWTKKLCFRMLDGPFKKFGSFDIMQLQITKYNKRCKSYSPTYKT
jgi:hypothetical protein